MNPILNHHIYPKFFLTPLATAMFVLPDRLHIKCVYIFGIRIIRITLAE
jgi:hypothetical protein